MIVSLHAETKIDGDGTVVLPGLINTHAHLELSALHGAFSDGMPTEILLHAMAVFSKLRDEYNYLGRAGFRLAALNFINAGITTVNTQDIVPERGVDALGGSGLRAFMCPGVGDLLWERSTDAQLDRAQSFIDTHHESYDGRIRATIGPFDDIVCTESFWREIATLAAEYPDLLVHTHVLGDDLSDLNAKADHLGGPVDLLEDIGLWNDRLVAAHFRAADERDARRAAGADVGIAHCPLYAYQAPDDSGTWMPVPALTEHNATISLGLDDVYFSDSYNLFNTAREARVVANQIYGAQQFSSFDLLRMLTRDGAAVLNMERELSSLEPGTKADMILVDMESPRFRPVTNLPALLVNGATPADVTTTIVNGEILMRDDEIVSMDADAVIDEVERAVERFVDDSSWDLDIAGSSCPDWYASVREMPKLGPLHLGLRLARGAMRDKLPIYET